MSSYYSFEKGKFGGPCGTIYPFFTNLSGLSPTDDDYKTYAPAGYLKCRGQILSADQYPNLARVLGVGDQCLYKKDGTQLQNKNPDGTGGTFQLPDLGSKYLATGTTNQYNNIDVLNPSTNLMVGRAGISVTLSTASQAAEFTYNGDFIVPGRDLSFSGNFAVSSPGSTPANTVSISQMLAHGHYHTITIGRRINVRGDAARRGVWVILYYTCRRRGVVCDTNGNTGVTYVALEIEEEGSDTGTSHRHGSVFPRFDSQNRFGSVPQTNISASSLTTTVTVNTRNTFKMDDIAPKFILCEYLIKF